MTRSRTTLFLRNLAVTLSQLPWDLRAIRDGITRELPLDLRRSAPAAALHLLAAMPGSTTPDPGTIARALGTSALAHRLAEHLRTHALTLNLAGKPTPFRPAAALSALPLPRLETPPDLCDWLAITQDQLTLLSDPIGLSARNPNPYARNYLVHLIPKPNGTQRWIEEPRPLLKKVQRRILAGILNRVPPHPAAFGFVTGRSAAMAAAKHCGEAMVLTFDIENFFPGIPFSRVYALFRAVGFPRATAMPLTQICTAWGPRHHRHLPQGAPTSPALANLAVFRLDARLTGLARRFDATYTRYADDLTFSGDRHIAALLPIVPQILHAEGFTPNPAKTRAQPAHRNQTVTGITVNQHLNLNRAAYDRLKAQVHHLTTGRTNATPALLAHLRGRLDWLSQLNPARADRLSVALASVTSPTVLPPHNLGPPP